MPRREDQYHKLLKHLREVLAEQKCVEGDDLDVEALVLLAMGRVDALPAADRRKLLRRIAGDPEAADLLRELVRTGPVPPWYWAAMGRASGMVWLVAGLVTVTLCAWRLADPPVGSYVEGLTASEAPAALVWANQDQMRAHVIFASVVLWLVVSLVRHWMLPGWKRALITIPAGRSITARSDQPTNRFVSDRC